MWSYLIGENRRVPMQALTRGVAPVTTRMGGPRHGTDNQ